MSRQMRNQMLGNRYRLLGLIGEGGMASVYRATDTKLDRKVAVKVLHPHLSQNEDVRHRFQQEARALSGIDHPNIVKIYDFSGAESEQLWIVTEILQGATLSEFVRKFSRSSLHPIVAAIIVQEVCKALSCAHDQSIVHRDVKPDNIMVLSDGRIKLMDFGIAKDARANSMTMTGTFMGSPSYMSPEQVRGRDIDHRSDIYSLAILFYEIVTGVLPYTGGSTADVINKIMIGKFLEPRDVSAAIPLEVNSMILKGMSSEVSKRYQAIADFGRELARFLNGYGFMESHIELERFFRDRQMFEARLRRVQFARVGSQERAANEDRTVLLPETALASTETVVLGQRPYPSHKIPGGEGPSKGPGKPPLPPIRAHDGRATRQTGVSYNRRIGRVSRRETQIFSSGSSRSVQFVGMSIAGIILGIMVAGAFELAERISLYREQTIDQAPVATPPASPVAAETSQRPATPPLEAPRDEGTPESKDSAASKRQVVAPATPAPSPSALKRPRHDRSESEPAKTPTRLDNPRPTPKVAIRRPIEPASDTLTPPLPSDVQIPVTAPAPASVEPEPAPVKPRVPTGQLIINAQPAAEIFIDGRLQGTTNDPEISRRGLKLTAGRHQIELKRRGFNSVARTVNMDSGDTKTLNIRLEKDQKSLIRFTVHSNFAPAKALIENGSYRRELDIVNETVSINLPAAQYKVRVEYGTQVIERMVTIGSRDALTFYAEFRKEE